MPFGDTPPSRSVTRSRWITGTLIVAAIGATLAIAVAVLPTPLARWALSRQLQDTGITAKGLDTLDVDLAQGEVRIGPVQFAGSGGEPAQLVTFGFDASLSSLLQRRVLFDKMIVRGLDIHVRRVVDGPIAINGIRLTDYLPAADAPGREAPEPKGVSSPSADGGEDGGWGTGIDTFVFRDGSLLLTSAAGGRLVVTVARLELQGFRTWAPEKPGTFALEGEANGITFTLSGEARPFADVVTVTAEAKVQGVDLDRIRRFTGPLAGLQPHQGRLDAQAKGAASLFPDGRIEGRADGSAQLEGVRVAKPDLIEIRTPEGRVRFDASVALDPSDALRLQGSGEAQLQQVKAARPDGAAASAESVRADLSGLDVVRTGGSGASAAQLTRLVGKVDVEIAGAEATLPPAAGETAGAETVRLEVGALKFDVSTVDEAQADTAAPLRVAGSVEADEISATVPGALARQPLEGSVQRLEATLHEASAAPSGTEPVPWQARFDAEAAGVTARVAGGDVRMELQRVSLTNVKVGDRANVSAEALELENPSVRLTRRFITAMTAGPEQPEAKLARPATEKPAPPATPIVLERATLVGTGTIQFDDATVQPATHLRADIDTLVLRDIDTGNPQQRITLELAGTLGELARLGAEGWATPFAEQRDFDVSARATGVQLHAFSGYAAQATGMVIDSGTLQAEVDATAADGQLNGVLSGVVRNLDMVASQTETKSSFPVELAFALLEDSERKITLRVPVSGNLNAPQFDLSDAVEQAFSGAVRKVVLGALDLVFLPKTITQALIGSDDTDQISRPVTFSPGSAELGPEARQVTDRLVDLLKGRPKLAIRICGRATAQDLSAIRTRRLNRQVLRAGGAESASAPEYRRQDREDIVARMHPELERLAAERTRAVRRRLIAQGVTASQLSECRPILDTADRSDPGVVVSLQVS